MSLTIQLYRNNSRPNVADKDLHEIGETHDITLKDNCSVQNPILLMRRTTDIPPNLNYLYIEDFDRYYFITDITAVRDNLIQISCKCDVLTTAFKRVDDGGKSRLGKCAGIVYRSQRDYNLYLDDGYFKVLNKPKIQTKPFSSGFSQSYNFVMAVAGGRTI